MRRLMFLVYITGVVLIIGNLIGCSGMEVGAKLGVYRVDERQESQRMHNVPLKCYLWSNCSESSEQLK
jgi:hypothetical protein